MGNHTLFVLAFDPASGRLSVDDGFRDPGNSRAGVSFNARAWPHGFAGRALPHGAVFSR